MSDRYPSTSSQHLLNIFSLVLPSPSASSPGNLHAYSRFLILIVARTSARTRNQFLASTGARLTYVYGIPDWSYVHSPSRFSELHGILRLHSFVLLFLLLHTTSLVILPPYFRMVYFSALDITVQLKDSDTKQALNEYPHPIFDKTNLHDDRPDDDLYERYWREDSATVRANPQGQDPEHNGLRPRIIRNLQYCGEAEAGKRFVIGVYFGTQFPYKDYDVYIRIYVDGQWACGASIERKRFRKQWGHRYTNYAALETKDGWTTSPRYYFAPVEFSTFCASFLVPALLTPRR